MLLAGLGVGALASQLGSVTVSSVPDEQSGEVGGVQNNAAVPKDLASQAQVELAGGIPFISDKDLQAALDKANVPPPDCRCDRQGKRNRPYRRAARIIVGACCHRIDRTVLQPPDPHPATLSNTPRTRII